MKADSGDHLLIRAAVSLVCGMLALIACYIVISRASRSRTDVYAAFTADGTLPIVKSAVFPHGTVNPNTATAEELKQIPGIGPKTAEAIILERETNGPFRYPEDLMSVSGIGPKKLESFLPYLDFSQ